MSSATLDTFPSVTTAPDPGRQAVYDNLRDRVARDAPDIAALALVSTDGLLMCGYGRPEEDMQHIAAACSGLSSLAKGLTGPTGGEGVLHLNITMVKGHITVTSCGDGSLLAVVVEAGRPISPVIREIVRIARGFAPQMGSEPRATAETGTESRAAAETDR
ncbi:roadblock/LC7 domain-containing protein [Streptomyces sp. NPDC018045]|uniref:roadblock/LC7 domain-containing protein n=1 Tax=Streptomyces sp. NPDC018045 TaxID=3365037 RepID=UPI0037AECFB3